ncbi:phage holin family protein [Tsukamurella sp. 8F]|uniref:phage holin family protein n=1 Tax=unclassified Tsukamurella TaxID=2633480 RepID=UPI0023B917AE|nr:MULTISPECIES: phage holin family protein [unclassified Tsukamurella]MDF0532155.1 phage holin family protein [Tsukamurella sp. 8J]MDF0589439.1 phage holin family protein [Tsukamurella sp. 8F]
MGLLLRLVVNAVALAAATWLVPGIHLTAGTTQNRVLTLLVVAVIFGVLNAVVKPILSLFSVVFILLTLGLFLIVINAVMLLLASWAAQKLGQPWHVDGFWPAVWGSLVISVVSWLLSTFVRSSD